MSEFGRSLLQQVLKDEETVAMDGCSNVPEEVQIVVQVMPGLSQEFVKK